MDDGKKGARERIRISQAIVVEGKYDRIKIQSVFDAMVIETDGFALFSRAERLAFIRRVANERGIIVLTDSDGAGFVIRRYLKGAIDPARVTHVYIPDLPGKEKRKEHPSKEGLLGVEGVPAGLLIEAFRRAGVNFLSDEAPLPPEPPLTMADLYADGLTGQPDSRARRARVLQMLSLPGHLSTHGLLEALNALVPRQEYRRAVEKAAAHERQSEKIS